jgi:putative transposase
MCRILGVSPSGYYAWNQRLPSRRRIEDEKLTLMIKEWHARSREPTARPGFSRISENRGVVSGASESLV